MNLESRIEVARGDFVLDVDIAAAAGETVVLLGPNGAGKSTLLRALAGLAPIDRGRIALAGSVLDDPAADTWIPTDRRSVGFVFQDHLLFPHLSALENVAFGLRARHVARTEARRRAAAWLERVGLADRASARPRALSGGQSQRVALARALVLEPQLLLLDEPLAALDATVRTDTRRDLRRHLSAHPGCRIVVTHDPIDAFALADRLIVLEGGRVAQEGTVDELREQPRSRYVADLVGVNLYRGRGAGHHVEVSAGTALVVADPIAGDVLAVVHPRAVALHRRPPDGTPRNVWSGTVEHLDFEGDRVRVAVRAALPITAEITPGAVRELELHEGTPVWASVKATEIGVYPA